MAFDVASFYELKALAQSRPSVTHLSLCDPPLYGFDPPSKAVSALQALDVISQASYPDFRGLFELLEKIASQLHGRYDISIAPENLLVTNGLHEAFALIGAAAKGGAFAVQNPGYLPMVSILQGLGDVVGYPCDEAEGWNPDIRALRTILADNRGVQFLFLITPNNPTGAVYSTDVLEAMAGVVRERDLVLVTNEVYDGLAEDGFVSALEVCGDTPVLYLNGFSKTYRLAGLRLGYMAFHDPANRKREIWKAITHLARLRYGVNLLVQYVALAALDETPSERAQVFGRMWAQKAALLKAVQESRHLQAVPFSGNAFVFARIEGNDLGLCRQLLTDHGYFVYPGSPMGARGRSHLCLVCLHPEELLRKGVETIDTLIEAGR
jgi:aspartate/methionine/tyrosine aminotransferase